MPDPPGAPLLAALVGAVFVAGLTSGTVGLGYAQVAAAAFALLVDPKAAIALLSITVPPTATGQIVKHRRQGHHAARVRSLLIAGLLGVPLGVALLTILPSRVIALLLGLFTLMYVATSLRKVALRVQPGQERLLGPLVGLTAGIANGAVGVSGPILASYLLALDLPAAAFAFTISTLFTAMSLLRLAGLALGGEITPLLLAVGLGLTVPALLGQQLGFWLQGRVSREAFRRAVLFLLFLAGVGLLRRGVAG